ncbi:MAG TPA: phosphoglucosamine mutase, partial [Candidatus Methylomirabilis sp.]|nr:phosphoglucosamine mutase [Candidatus Methylomirabilis sp.]
MSRLFGTDGIRGVANAPPLTTALAQRLGRDLVATLSEHHGASRVRLVVGRDTRLSGPMLEGGLVAGALSAGADVYAVGVLPTPGIAFLTRRLEAQGGVVLSASHNPFEDNGIKIFSSEGAKLPDAWEEEIERRLDGPDAAPRPTGAGIGRLVAFDDAESEYIAHASHGFPFDLSGLTLVLDCAHGATARVAPRVFRGFGARVVVLNARPDGQNINRGSGALHPEALEKKVLAARAHVGLAFDGDGDRLIAVDERGTVRDGDFVLAILGRRLAAQGRLAGGVVVTTVMANLGLDHALQSAGVRTVKTQVGDRYVLEEMLKLGANLGGEQSGHLLFLDHSSTGDGIVSALHLLGAMRESGQPLSELSRCMTKFPQVLVNVPVREKRPFDAIPGLSA